MTKDYPTTAPDPANPSPKVIAASAVALLTPVLVGALAELVDYLVSPEGQGLFSSLPVPVSIFVLALLSGLGAVIAGYLKRDPARQPLLVPADVDPNTVAAEQGLTEQEVPDTDTLAPLPEIDYSETEPHEPSPEGRRFLDVDGDGTPDTRP